MNSMDALGHLRNTAPAFFTTGDAAGMLRQSLSATTKQLSGLASARLIRQMRAGHWALDPDTTIFKYAGWVVTPMPSYVSVYSALYHHGMIERVRGTVYVASLAKTRTLKTSLGSFSVHQIAPPLFNGYTERGGVRMATPEKALFDTLYLGRARSGKFADTTGIKLPSGFDCGKLRAYAGKIEDQGARKRVSASIESFLGEWG